MEFKHETSRIREAVEKRLEALFGEKNLDILYPPMRYPIEAGGKRLRPVLMALSCMTVGGRLEDCLDAATAVELFHTFTLVHDDIMDHDDLRRGSPTVHVKWDAPTAILAGDGLVIMAYQSLLRTKHPEIVRIQKIITEGLLLLCEGQALDKAFEKMETVSLDAYLDMIDKKTAKLIEVSCEVGAMIGNADQREQTSAREFGALLGRAFQVQDDLLDVISEESVLGKPVCSDLRERKKTVLTAHFLNHAPEETKRTFRTLWDKSELGDKDVLTLRTLLEESGSIEAARGMIQTLSEEAVGHLNRLPNCESRRHLATLVDQLRTRIS